VASRRLTARQTQPSQNVEFTFQALSTAPDAASVSNGTTDRSIADKLHGMAIALGPFDTLPWERGAHPLERKKLVPGRDVVLLEFAAGFVDPNWCERSHALYVIEGALEFELDHGSQRVGTGQSLVIDRGTRHRAKNPGARRAVAFVVSDL
jgi:mannose-6-phosphate isomerase-like protein (cupin superfamily)